MFSSLKSLEGFVFPAQCCYFEHLQFDVNEVLLKIIFEIG